MLNSASYLFMNYRREQVGRRISYIYLCSVSHNQRRNSFAMTDSQALSGAFGGLIAFGLIRINTGPLVGWQYLYLVEGGISVLAGPLAYFWIPRELPKAWFYNAEEKEASAKRATALVKANQHTDKFSWPEVFKGLTAWQVGYLMSSEITNQR